MEEERGEAQRDVLLRWGTEGRTQQFHARYRDEESSAAGRDRDGEEIRDTY